MKAYFYISLERRVGSENVRTPEAIYNLIAASLTSLCAWKQATIKLNPSRQRGNKPTTAKAIPAAVAGSIRTDT